MIENIVTCDRCRKKCEGTTYYTVEIYGHDINPTNDGSQSMTTATQNAQTNTYKLFNHEKHHCEKCRDKIVDFLSNTKADAFVEPNVVLNKEEPTTIQKAISYYNYGIKCDIFKEPVTTYAKLAVDALKNQQECSSEWVEYPLIHKDYKTGKKSIKFRR